MYNRLAIFQNFLAGVLILDACMQPASGRRGGTPRNQSEPAHLLDAAAMRMPANVQLNGNWGTKA